MSVLFAALLLGAATPPPPDDDDSRARAPSAARRDQEDDDDEDEGKAQPSSPIIVTAHKLDSARTQVEASLGATSYSLTNDAIENRPGGETGRIADILMQAPGVTLSGKTLNVRGSPADQVRINGVIVPEAIPDPADLISSRLAETTRLITGTLPAQFGFAPAGVISITTKNGLYKHGGEAELFGGSDGMVEPAFEWAGSAGATSLFASGELEHGRSQVGDAVGNVTTDRRTGVDGLGFADHVIDQHDRISFLFGGSRERHRFGETAAGAGTEANDNGYAVAAYQHSDSEFSLQAALFGGLANDSARLNERTDERRGSWGAQIDASEIVGTSTTLRFGLLATRSTARERDLTGLGSSAARTSLGLYAQDEWKLAPSLTLNGGARLEWLRGLNSSAVVEPRVSLVGQPARGLTAHIGYARYASAPSLGDEGKSLPDELDDYLDAGVQQQLGAFTLGLDAYTRTVHNLVLEHQPLGSVLATAFEFERGRMEGVELASTFARGATTAWANLSFSKARGRTILGGAGLFDPASLLAASRHYVALASDRPVSASGGFTRSFGKLTLGADVLLSSGAVRTLSVSDPNGSRRSAYALLGLSAVYHARIVERPADVRVDLTNLTNVHYATSDAANLEGGWTYWGRRRAITIGIEQTF